MDVPAEATCTVGSSCNSLQTSTMQLHSPFLQIHAASTENRMTRRFTITISFSRLKVPLNVQHLNIAAAGMPCIQGSSCISPLDSSSVSSKRIHQLQYNVDAISGSSKQTAAHPQTCPPHPASHRKGPLSNLLLSASARANPINFKIVIG